MKFMREELVDILDVAKLGIDARDFIPILSHFCFNGKTVTAYNDFVGVEVACKTNFSLALQANTLMKLLSSVSSSEVEIGFAKTAVFFKSGAARTGVRARLPYMGEEDFLFKWPNTKRLNKWGFSEAHAEKFFLGLQACLSSVGDQMPAQMGVTLNETAKSFAMYSTNNKAISKYTMALPKAPLGVKNIILPTVFCQAVLKGYQTYGLKDVVFMAAKDYVIVEFGDQCRMYGKLVSNKDPLDFEAVIKEHLAKDYKANTHKVPKNFTQTFERALLMLSNDLHKVVNVTTIQNTMTVEAKSPLGKVKSSAVFKKNLPKKDVGVDAELAVKAAADCTTVYFGKRVIVFGKGTHLHLLSTQEA